MLTQQEFKLLEQIEKDLVRIAEALEVGLPLYEDWEQIRDALVKIAAESNRGRV